MPDSRSSKTVPPSTRGTARRPRRPRAKATPRNSASGQAQARSVAPRSSLDRQALLGLQSTPATVEQMREVTDRAARERREQREYSRTSKAALLRATARCNQRVAKMAGERAAYSPYFASEADRPSIPALRPIRTGFEDDRTPSRPKALESTDSGRSDTPPPESRSSSAVCLSCPHGMRVLIDYQPGLVVMTRFGDVLLRLS